MIIPLLIKVSGIFRLIAQTIYMSKYVQRFAEIPTMI